MLSTNAEPIKTTCPYCGVGCGVLASMNGKGEVSVKGDPEHPANFGRLCSKGTALAETVGLEGRLLYPEVNGGRVSWDEALGLVAKTFQATIKEYGPDSVAFYVSGQMLTEDYYVANKLMKGFIGSANIDTNSRLCMASSVAGHRRAFGADVVPGNYEDLELADMIVLTGSNLAWCHPVLFQRIVAAKAARPDMKIVLIDPRRTMTAEIADLHLPIRADGDIALFSGLLAYLANNAYVDADYVAQHTTGFSEALLLARDLTQAQLCEKTGLSEWNIRAFYNLFAETQRVVTIYSQGVNQSESGTDKVNSIINCHLATGRVGLPGCGPFSVTGQPNAMGGREVGGLANMLAAHMELENSADRDRVRKFWNSPTIANRPGLKAVDLFQAVGNGQIKAIWIMATNPVVSMPDADVVKAALKACPFVVVSDIADDTDTLALADVKLPATGWGEKDGTVTNSERRISRQRKFLPLIGDMKPDWWIVSEVARHMGFAKQFNYQGSDEIFAEHARLSGFENEGQRKLDIGFHAEISRNEYDALSPFQWPKRRVGGGKSERLYSDGVFSTPDGKARFVAVSQVIDKADDEPFILNTGRIRDQWHTMTRTGKSSRLSSHLAEPFVEINPDDALALGISDADLVEVWSAHGRVVVRALLTSRQKPGYLFVPMHWTDAFSGSARIGTLVAPNVDPVSGQPALKSTRANAAKFNACQYGFAVCRQRPEVNNAAYWARAKCDGGWRIELAFLNALNDPEGVARRVMGIPDHAEMLTFHDEVRGLVRFAFFEESHLLGAFYLSPSSVVVSRSWAVEELAKPYHEPKDRFSVIAGRAGANQADKGALVCACFSVGVNEISSAITKDGCRDVEAIGHLLKAGTNCGSCRTEIKGIIDAHSVIAAE